MTHSTPFPINDELLQYMHFNPFFNIEQQRRYEYILQLGQDLSKISKSFLNYQEIGIKLCNEFATIRSKFDQFDFVFTDELYKPLITLFLNVDNALTNHFSLINETVVKPLNIFVQNDIENLSSFYKENKKQYENYKNSEEKFINSSKENLKQDKELNLIQSHSFSSLTFFDFSMKMELTELKIKSVLPQTVSISIFFFFFFINIYLINFLISIREPFSECINEILTNNESINFTLNRISDLEIKQKEFSCESAKNKLYLSSQIPVYWDRLHKPFPLCNSLTIQGYLWKKCGRFSISWEKRFFMISNGILSYSKDVEDILKNSKKISLLYCSCKPDYNQNRSHCFSITNKNIQIILQTLSDFDVNYWLTVIQNNISNQLNIQNVDITEQNPISNEQNKLICADCSYLGANWCSINWGLPLCDVCSGIHRSFQNNISKIKSLTLDEIDYYTRLLMEIIGTEKGNEILEFNCEEKINFDSTFEEKKLFIQNKYQNKLFINSNINENIFELIQNQDLISIYKYLSLKGINNFENKKFHPLHAACIIGNPLIVNLILLHLNNPNIEDENLWTPLSYAIFYNQKCIIDLLLLYGSNPILNLESNAYLISLLKNNEELINKFESYKPINKEFQLNEELLPPNKEFLPQEFKLIDFIDEKKLNAFNKNNKGMSENEKKKLRGALNTMRTRLSTGAHTTSGIFKYNINETDSSD